MFKNFFSNFHREFKMLLGHSFILILTTLLSLVLAVHKTDDSLRNEFRKFIVFFEKEYKNLQEENMRFEIWKKNLVFIENFNADTAAGKHTFSLKMNRFGDLVSLLI
jgi:hypothetical protein